MDIQPGKLLKWINSPEDLKKLRLEQLPELSKELREYIIDVVSVYGGHFGASLGVVELTVALHYAFNTPEDPIVWDVGHQAYGHKILTGRRDQFHTNRQWRGLCGFPNIEESKYDAFGVGHSSTSISAALGMAMAAKLQGYNERQHVAVIGDGAMTGGLAFEALNHAGVANTDLLVVLNDNCMSIDPNVGALKEYLTDITTSTTYNRFRDEVWKALGRLQKLNPSFQKAASQLESSLKSLVLGHSNFFESLNFRYFGPVDGHDVTHLAQLFDDLKKIPGPKLLHCVTVKGKGYDLAEKDQTKWHSPGLFDKITGEIKKKSIAKPEAPKYQKVFGETIVELAKKNEKIVGVTPAMPSGSSLNIMMEEIPERSFDVGIAEQHAVTFSAGMAIKGLKPFCNVYSTFLQRGFDQVIHDVAIQNLSVVFCLDRAGLVGNDGATHQGLYDLAYMRCVPNMIVSAPMNEQELRSLMYTAQLKDHGPFSIRYPRGKGVMPNWKTPFEELKIGKGRLVSKGEDIAILSIGHIGNLAQKALKNTDLSVAHYDMRFVKPLDTELLDEVFSKFNKVITIEDGCLKGGFGSAVLEYAAESGIKHIDFHCMGVPDEVIEHGSQMDQYKYAGIDPDSIAIKLEEVYHREAIPPKVSI